MLENFLHMSNYISDNLRSLVAERAHHICEYCLIHEEDTNYGCQVDHIISIKHGGSSNLNNLAYACVFCNRNKGSDIGSIIDPQQDFIRFYNPRTDIWTEHFRLEGVKIKPISDIWKVTAFILNFNNVERIIEREALVAAKRYPPYENIY